MNKNDFVTEMLIKVTVDYFHDTHDAAHQILSSMEAGITDWTDSELSDALLKLQAGQRLTDAETGPDASFATNYREAIALVETEKLRREREEFETLDKEYKEYIAKEKREWLAKNRRCRTGSLSEPVLEVMNESQLAEVKATVNRWKSDCTLLSEAWWKERGYGVIWPNDDSQPMKVQKFVTT